MYLSSSPACHMLRQSNPPYFNHPNIIWQKERLIKLLIMNAIHSPVTSSLLSPNIFHNSLFSNILSRFYSLNVRGQVSHHLK
jgi:hypothetical protein